MTTTVSQHEVRSRAEIRRARTLGWIFLGAGLLILLLFIPDAAGLEPLPPATFGERLSQFGNALRGAFTSEVRTTFVFDTGTASEAILVPDLPVRTGPALYGFMLLCIFFGAWQLARGFKRATLILGIVAGLFVLAFLTWGARTQALQITDLLSIALIRAVPIAFAALSGVLCERCAVINIAIEGMMLTGAFFASLMGSIAERIWGMPPWAAMLVGLLGAIVVGGLLGLLLAVLAIRYKVNQIIAGTAINILAVGLTSFLGASIMAEFQQTLNNPSIFPQMPIPYLSQIPVLGPIFFEHNLLVYLLFALLIVVHIMLFYTRWGLRTRAVGEHPKAADTLGINVFKTRYINVALGGMVAGIGGAFLILGAVGRFDEVMTAGKGFIGLAAMIFGNWMPFGAFGAAMIFGFAEALQVRLTMLRVGIPSQIMAMAPYLVTILALAGIVGEVTPPAADGQVYEKT